MLASLRRPHHGVPPSLTVPQAAPDTTFAGVNEGGKSAKVTGRRRGFFRLPMRWRKGGRLVRNRLT